MERETAGSISLFSALVCAIERSQAELIEVIEMSRRAAEHQADAMIRQLELEVKELRRRESALAELAQSDDYIHCIKVGEALMRLRLMLYRRIANIMGNLGRAEFWVNCHFLYLSFPDVPHPQRRSTCQRLVCGVAEL